MSRGLKDKRKVRILETGQVFQTAQELAYIIDVDSGAVYRKLAGQAPRGVGKREPLILHFEKAAPDDKVTDRFVYAFRGPTTMANMIMNDPGVTFHIPHYVFMDALQDSGAFHRLMLGMAMHHRADFRIGQERKGLTYTWKGRHAA